MHFLVTGGSGFFGGVLKRRLLADGHSVTNLDLAPDPDTHERLTSIRGDIRNYADIEAAFEGEPFAAVFHCAAMLAHVVRRKALLRQTNVDGTRYLAEAARAHGVRPFVFVSSNCVYARSYDKPVRETEPPTPAEIYGRSKLEAEQLLREFEDDLNVVTLRPPTIIDEGRLGLLTILFDFIREGRKVWVVGDGDNRYQFVYAQDLADACVRAATYPRSDLFHVGSRNVKPLAVVYRSVIEQAGTSARVASLPKAPTLWAMRAAYRLGLSPLGPYQNRMITSNFVFDTRKIETALGWKPTLTNEEMLLRAYRYYDAHFDEIHGRRHASAHRQAAKMGVIRVLKWLS
jgi:nucleoside-diphosphate-sugar epimerase